MAYNYGQRKALISYVDPFLSSTGYTDFIDFEDLSPGSGYPYRLMYLGAEEFAGSAVKGNLLDLQGSHGGIPVESKMRSKDVTFRFLIRRFNSEYDVNIVAKEFVTFLYSIGEFHVTFSDSSVYRRYIYNSSDNYTILDGIFGYDAQLVLTFTAIDSLQWEKELTETSRVLTLDTPQSENNLTWYGRAYTSFFVNTFTISQTDVSLEIDLDNTAVYNDPATGTVYYNYFGVTNVSTGDRTRLVWSIPSGYIYGSGGIIYVTNTPQETDFWAYLTQGAAGRPEIEHFSLVPYIRYTTNVGIKNGFPKFRYGRNDVSIYLYGNFGYTDEPLRTPTVKLTYRRCFA